MLGEELLALQHVRLRERTADGGRIYVAAAYLGEAHQLQRLDERE